MRVDGAGQSVVPKHSAESSWIVQAQETVVENEVEMVVLAHENLRLNPAQTPRHPEMDQHPSG
jgi:hypothetical protein